MFKNKSFSIALYMGSVVFCIVWLTYFMFKNEAPVDSGDGLMHYFIAQATWQEPVYFLDHWGKPFFSFLASPFAQFGLNGMVIFNIFIFLVTCFISRKLFVKLNTPVALQVLFPLILLIANDYSATILGGLTEPLFNLGVIICALLLFQKKWAYFALVVSLLPFMRSEGQLPMVLAAFILLVNKQFKVIPLLLSGFIIYAIIGYFLLDDFWWYFNNSPYSMNDGIYGHGTWDHYLTSYRNYLGNPGVYILMVGIPTLIYFIIKRKWEFVQVELTFFGYGIFIGVIVLHSYFWATGQNGSLGLTRIATQGMPLFILIHLAFIGRWNWSKHVIANSLFLVAAIFLALALTKTKRYPQKESTMELQISKAYSFLQQQNLEGKHLYFMNPYFTYLLDENPMVKDAAKGIQYYTYSVKEDVKTRFSQGDYIIWDSHFALMDNLVTIEEVDNIPELILVKEFVSGIDRVRIYQVVPVKIEDSKPI